MLFRSELSLVFTDDPFISELNLRYLGRKGPTNVLAFPLSEGEPEFLGEIVISMETASREAKRAGIGREERVAELLIHGILHLWDYDHRDRREARAMNRRAKEILQAIKSPKSSALSPKSKKKRMRVRSQQKSPKSYVLNPKSEILIIPGKQY